MTPQTAADRLYQQLVEDEIRDLLEEAGALDLLRDYAREMGTRDDMMATLRGALFDAIEMARIIHGRSAVFAEVPEWVRTQEAAE